MAMRTTTMVNKASSHVVAHAFINSLRNDRGLFQF